MNSRKIDPDILDELIAKCEDKMVSPFRKKAVAVEIKPEPDHEAETGNEGDEADKPDLSDMDMDELLELYEKMKSEKE